MSFKVASAAGTEDQQVRKIKNPFADRATRVDYYQLVRKWRVDLYRYGVRLTFDFAIPEPGSDILSKIREIERIKAALEQGFADPEADPETTLPWAMFDLKPSAIDPSNYLDYAATYGAVVEPPKTNPILIDQPLAPEFPKDPDETAFRSFTGMVVEVPDDYLVANVAVSEAHYGFTDQDKPLEFTILTDFSTWYGQSGKFPVEVQTKYIYAYFLEVKVWASLRPEAYSAWQLKTWNTLREAALARYEENRQNLKQRLSTLLEEVGGQDPLSLRKIEREEVMKGVLRWLFGPSFEFVPADVPEDLYAEDEAVVSKKAWDKVLAQGEIIKFLHHAIEWENMLYFLYPYFWAPPSQWEFKKYLDHPDLMHRVFLKSGRARVVLTIRPGFEKHFVSFLETGKFDDLSADDPYWKITDEMEAYAKTNYPGIRAANPVEDARPLLSPLQRKAWEEMQAIMALLEEYHDTNQSYPTTEQGLAELAAFGTVPSADPWGNTYVYASPGLVNDYDLASYGADGAEGGEDNAADITSWAEANLIGRWYEYTPTSALDIAFDEERPSA
jgi:hypothetical protein